MPSECTGNPIAILLCEIAHYVPAPILWGLSIFVVVFPWWIRFEWQLLGNPANPAFQKQIDRIRAKADDEPVESRYRSLLNSLLRTIDRLFGPVSTAQTNSRVDRLFGCQPWTATSYERLLSLSFAYPMIFLLVATSLSGQGSSSVEIPLMLASTLLGYFLGVFAKRRLERVSDILNRSMLIAVIIIVIASAALFVTTIDDIQHVYIATVFIFTAAFAATVALSVAIAAILAFSVSIGLGLYFIPIAITPDFPAGSVAIAALAVILTALTYINIARDRAERYLATYWIIATCVTFAIFIVATKVIHDDNFSYIVLIAIFLPLVNAPLDWLSLGITRGLLLCIARHQHQSVSALVWALFDLVLAIALLLAVAASSFFAYALANALSSSSFYPIEELRSAVVEGNELSVGIWLMLASTLVPTLMHFLVALMAFVSLPFSREKANDTAIKLQSARDEALRRVRDDTNHSASDTPVDAYARRWAMAYFVVSWPAIFLLWLVITSYLLYVIYATMQWIFVTSLPAM